MGALLSVDGIGSKLEERVLRKLGGEDQLSLALDGMEIDRLASIDGIGEERAVRIFRRLKGLDHSGLASTGRAREIRNRVVERIAAEARTLYGRNRVRLLNTLETREAAEARLDEVEGYVDLAESVDIERARSLLDRVEPLKEPSPSGDHLVIVEREESYTEMLKHGLNRFCSLALLEERPAIDGEFVIYYYSRGLPDLVDAANVEPVSDEGEHWRVAPDSILSFFRENYRTLDATAELLSMTGDGEHCQRAVELVDGLRALETEPSDVRGVVEEEREEASRRIYDDVKDLSLSGSEVLESMGDGVPGPVSEAMDRHLTEAEDRVRKRLGISISPFTRGFPLGVDEDEVVRAERRLEAGSQSELFRKKVEAAEELRNLRADVEGEVSRALELDFQLALGGFTISRGLTRPAFGESLELEGALHLDLPDGDPVDYGLYGRDAALLTGANSGGKTTLLETVAQVVVMSHMGLPVPADCASVEWFDEMHFHSPGKGMDAGAFETFLRKFLPLCEGEGRRLILADELEAVTELEAAAAIIGGFIQRLRGSGSRCILVTHMPEQILSRVDVRVDGIEATGLGDDAELVVERSPVIGRRASSTPELILERLARREGGGLYEEFLGELTRDSV